jgi:hypothetical protein
MDQTSNSAPLTTDKVPDEQVGHFFENGIMTIHERILNDF